MVYTHIPDKNAVRGIMNMILWLSQIAHTAAIQQPTHKRQEIRNHDEENEDLHSLRAAGLVIACNHAHSIFVFRLSHFQLWRLRICVHCNHAQTTIVAASLHASTIRVDGPKNISQLFRLHQFHVFIAK